MRTPIRRSRPGRGHADRSWPVLLLLVLLILVPTVCVLWFMNVATKSEHLAVREKLREAYQGHLTLVRERLDDHWTRKLKQSEELASNDHPSAVFNSCVLAGVADSVLCFDPSGRLSYPSPTNISSEGNGDVAWSQASQLEHVRGQYRAAADAYESIARSSLTTNDRDRAARAWQAAARCHANAGNSGRALEILNKTLHDEQYALAKDLQGRLIVADAELRVLEVTRDEQDADFMAILDRLKQRVLDYENSPLTAAQRRFLMNALQELRPELEFPTLSAERLAAEFIESQPTPPTKPVLYATGLRDVWQIGSSSGRVASNVL